MSYIEEFEKKLQGQVIPQTMKPDFAQFWQKSVEQVRAVPIEIKREKLETPYEKSFITWELTYNTHDDTKIHAWFSVPTGAKEKLPCVVFYHGGGSHKELYPGIMAAGVCCFAMDVRGEGGTSIDQAVYTSGGTNGGLMNHGVLDKENFFMHNIYKDAIRAIDVAASLPEVDPDRIVTYGGSQGGALSIVASALSGRSQKCYSGITSYCCLQQRVELGSGILSGVTEYLRKYPLSPTQTTPSMGRAGTYLFTGRAAVIYMRIRKADNGGDFMRTQRVRNVLSILADKCRVMTYDQAKALLDSIVENSTTTNMSAEDLLSALEKAFALRSCVIEELRLPVDGGYKQIRYAGMSVQDIDWNKSRAAMADYLDCGWLVIADEDEDFYE